VGVEGGACQCRRRCWALNSSKATTPNRTIAPTAHTRIPPAKGNSQRGHCQFVSIDCFSACDGGEELLLSALTVGGGVTCIGVGEGGTLVSSGGCMARLGTGCAQVAANMVRMARAITEL
jgi:hypothetical protein